MWTRHNDLRSVAEVGEFHQIVQVIVRRERGVAQHVTHVRRAEHVEAASHVEVVHGTVHAGKHVDENFAVSDALGVLFGTDNLEVAGLHAEVHQHAFGVAEIDVALDVERVVVVGIDGEVFQ